MPPPRPLRSFALALSFLVGRSPVASAQLAAPSDALEHSWEALWEPAWDDELLVEPGPMSLELSLSHERGPLEQETRVLAWLALPLGSAAAPFAPAPSAPEASPAPLGGEASAPGSESGARAPVAPSPPPTTESPRAPALASAAPATPPVVPARLPPAFVRELLARVQAASRLADGDRKLAALGRRARLSGLTPELRLRGVRGFDQTTSQEVEGLLPADTTTRDGNDSLVEGRLTFRLDRLVFASEEPALARQRAELAERAAKLTERTLELLVAWYHAERARVALVAPEDDAEAVEDALELELAAEAALLELHVLSGGWFVGTPSLARFLGRQASAGRPPEPRAESTPGQGVARPGGAASVAGDDHAPRDVQVPE